MNCFKISKLLTVSTLILLVCLCANAKGGKSAIKSTPHIRFTSDAPQIDGIINEKCWDTADILTGFTIPQLLDVVQDQSEVRILFDDKNLYIALKAFESSPNLIVRTGRNIFASDSFEIFIKPDPDKEDYYQLAISVSEKIYTGKNKAKWTPGITMKTGDGKDCWIAEIAIPLEDLGITASPAEQEIIINIVRNDWAERGGSEKSRARYSSFSLLEKPDFHVPEEWAKAVMTKAKSPAKRIINEPPFKNLLINPDFNLAKNNRPSGWKIPNNYWKDHDVQRMETMAMSGEWIVRATGKTYVVMQQKVKLTPGKTYTVRFKARQFGEYGSVGVSQILKGRVKHIVWGCPLTKDFRYYFGTFKARKDISGIKFFRIYEKKDRNNGVEFASIHLYEGKMSPLSIRKHVRRGMTKKIPGTELSIPANIYGRKSAYGKLKVLAISYTLFTSREFLEIFSGLDADVDILNTTGTNQDTYYTESEPEKIKNILDKGGYDLYIIGKSALRKTGEELKAKILKNVKKGAGLLLVALNHRDKPLVRFEKQFKDKPLSNSSYVCKGLADSLYPGGNPLKEIREAKIGNGKIVSLISKKKRFLGWNLQFRINRKKLDDNIFPFQRYARGYLARLIYYTAKRPTSIIDSVTQDKKVLKINLNDTSVNSYLEWELDDKTGKKVGEGKKKISQNKVKIELPNMDMSGSHVLVLHLKNENGMVSDYAAFTVDNNGPVIKTITPGKKWYKINGQAEFKLIFKGADDSMELSWKLTDFSGRVLKTGKVSDLKNCNVSIPLKSLYTNLGYIQFFLKKNDKVFDYRKMAVFVPDLDRKRLLNDYNVTVWPEGCTNPEAATFINKTLKKIGVSSKNGSWYILSLQDGLGTTTNLQRHEFNGFKKPKNHVRHVSLNDPKVIKKMVDLTKKRATQDIKYGPFSVAVVDEPDSSGYSGSAIVEIDSHPKSLKLYRQKMRKKYGRIENFNKRCSTNYKSFDELNIVLTENARKRKNFAEFIEWRNFMVDTWVGAFRKVTDAYRAISPKALMSMENSFGQRALCGNDYWKLLTKAGFGFSNEYTDAVHDTPLLGFSEFYRSFRPDMRVWGFIGYSFGKEAAQFNPWWFALHRFGGFSFYAAGTEVPGAASWGLVSIPSFAMTRKGQLLQEGIADLEKGIGKVFLEYDWKKRDIAILYSQASMLVAWCRGTEYTKMGLTPGSPYHDYFNSRHSLKFILEELLYQYDFVSPEQLADGKLNSYKTLILPHIEALSEKTINNIKDFMKKGGIVISDIIPGKFDELGTPRIKNPFLADIGKQKNFVKFPAVFNKKKEEHYIKLHKLLQTANIPPILKSNGVPRLKGREAMCFSKGKMNIFAITRDYRRASDNKSQNFIFPEKGHLYDIRKGKYLGEKDRVNIAIPNAGTVVYGLYPYKVTGITIDCQKKVTGGEDLHAKIRLKTSSGNAGDHVFRVELISPKGESKWFMKRNISAPEGQCDFTFRMAKNDHPGTWILKVTDVMTGITANKNFILIK